MFELFLSPVLMIAGLLLPGASGADGKQSRMTASQSQAISTIREAYAAFNRGDIAAAVKNLDPKIEWIEPAEFPGGGTYHGREGASRYLTQSRAAWDEVNSDPEQFIPAGDRIVVFVHARVRPKGSNEFQEVRLADVYTVRKGRIVQMRAFAQRDRALQWAGVVDRDTTP
jgi:ketosteroid isomerase-like protein